MNPWTLCRREIRARVMPAVIDELARWGVERFSVEAMAERHRLDAAMIYRYWGDRQRLIVDAAIADVETAEFGGGHGLVARRPFGFGSGLD